MISRRRLASLVLGGLLLLSSIVSGQSGLVPLPGMNSISNLVVLDKGQGTYMVQVDVGLDDDAASASNRKLKVTAGSTVIWKGLGTGITRVQFDGVPDGTTSMHMQVIIDGSVEQDEVVAVSPLTMAECFQTAVESYVAPVLPGESYSRSNHLIVVVPCMDLQMEIADGSSWYRLTNRQNVSTGVPYVVRLHTRGPEKMTLLRFFAFFKQRELRWNAPVNITADTTNPACELSRVQTPEDESVTQIVLRVNDSAVVTVFNPVTNTIVSDPAGTPPGWLTMTIPDLDFVWVTCELMGGGDNPPAQQPMLARRKNKE